MSMVLVGILRLVCPEAINYIITMLDLLRPFVPIIFGTLLKSIRSTYLHLVLFSERRARAFFVCFDVQSPLAFYFRLFELCTIRLFSNFLLPISLFSTSPLPIFYPSGQTMCAGFNLPLTSHLILPSNCANLLFRNCAYNLDTSF